MSFYGVNPKITYLAPPYPITVVQSLYICQFSFIHLISWTLLLMTNLSLCNINSFTINNHFTLKHVYCWLRFFVLTCKTESIPSYFFTSSLVESGVFCSFLINVVSRASNISAEHLTIKQCVNLSSRAVPDWLAKNAWSSYIVEPVLLDS